MRHDLTYPTLFNTLERGIRFGRATVVLLCRFAPFAITRSEAVRFVLELVFICECFKMGAVQGVNMKPKSYSINAWNRLGDDRNICLGSKNLCLKNNVLRPEGETLERPSKGVFDVALSLAIPVAYLVGNKCRCRAEFDNTVISDLC